MPTRDNYALGLWAWSISVLWRFTPEYNLAKQAHGSITLEQAGSSTSRQQILLVSNRLNASQNQHMSTPAGMCGPDGRQSCQQPWPTDPFFELPQTQRR